MILVLSNKITVTKPTMLSRLVRYEIYSPPRDKKPPNFVHAEFLEAAEIRPAVRHYTRDTWSEEYAGLFVSQPSCFPIP